MERRRRFPWASLLGHAWLAIAHQGDLEPLATTPKREEILRLVREKPGISMSALTDAAQVHWGTIQFHVLRLEHQGLVRTLRVGRRRLVFPEEVLTGGLGEEDAMLQEETCRRVASTILLHPGRGVGDLVDLTDLTPRTVYYHVKRLRDAGLVQTSQPGLYRGLTPAPRLYALLLEDL